MEICNNKLAYISNPRTLRHSRFDYSTTDGIIHLTRSPTVPEHLSHTPRSYNPSCIQQDKRAGLHLSQATARDNTPSARGRDYTVHSPSQTAWKHASTRPHHILVANNTTMPHLPSSYQSDTGKQHKTNGQYTHSTYHLNSACMSSTGHPPSSPTDSRLPTFSLLITYQAPHNILQTDRTLQVSHKMTSMQAHTLSIIQHT